MIPWEFWLEPVAFGVVCLVVSRVAAAIVDVVWERIRKKS